MPEYLTTVDYKISANIVNDACNIIESSQKAAFSAVNIALIQRNWLLGKRISEEIIGEDNRAEYGVEVIKKLSKELTQSTEKGLQNLLYTASMLSIKSILRFSKHRLENHILYSPGLIIWY